jgi:hypothetical protein
MGFNSGPASMNRAQLSVLHTFTLCVKSYFVTCEFITQKHIMKPTSKIIAVIKEPNIILKIYCCDAQYRQKNPGIVTSTL